MIFLEGSYKVLLVLHLLATFVLAGTLTHNLFILAAAAIVIYSLAFMLHHEYTRWGIY